MPRRHAKPRRLSHETYVKLVGARSAASCGLNVRVVLNGRVTLKPALKFPPPGNLRVKFSIRMLPPIATTPIIESTVANSSAPRSERRDLDGDFFTSLKSCHGRIPLDLLLCYLKREVRCQAKVECQFQAVTEQVAERSSICRYPIHKSLNRRSYA